MGLIKQQTQHNNEAPYNVCKRLIDNNCQKIRHICHTARTERREAERITLQHGEVRLQ